jgi:polyprenyl-phospho-N-acetylgalactosaminyl synthase
MSLSDIFVIVPAYNEGEMLQSAIRQLSKGGYSIVVVDDGSSVNQQSYFQYDPVYFIRHKINLGQGAALETGTVFALDKGAKYIVHFDADGQHRTEDIPALLQTILNDDCDVVFGSRFLTKAPVEIPFIKKLLIITGRYINYLFTGLLLSDAHNGLRAMNRMAAEKIRIRENRMSHASEILFLVKKYKLRFREVAVTIIYTDYSKEKGQSSWNSIRIFFDLILHKLFK